MKRVLALAEGQTEEAFLDRLLAPHLQAYGLSLIVTIVKTRRPRSGAAFKGGYVPYGRLHDELRLLLRDTNATAVTTMLDYYGLPGEFPGWPATGRTPHERVARLEAAFAADIADRRFIPFLTLHEFEALIFTDPAHVCDLGGAPQARSPLSKLRDGVASPEEIDQGRDTHPSAHIERHVPAYRKTTHGPIAAERIGLAAIRAACPHFDRWVARLETLAT